MDRSLFVLVMPELDPGIHAVTATQATRLMAWIAGSSPAMTGLSEPLQQPELLTGQDRRRE
jgi:hypothetical protein